MYLVITFKAMDHCPYLTNFVVILQGIVGFIRGEEGLDSSGLSSSAAVGVHLFSHTNFVLCTELINF